ncbi:DNA-directed RNA polymerase subunit D [Candidatus Micrarchaeota archaeon]|nr:DNA-directed RNA polymerase subunit D [Candidatus Micrarchaeota archaeon]
MRIKVNEIDDKSIEFTLSNTTIAFANAVRRICMNSVPTFAIESVTMYENSSSFFDEYVTNRLGLIPLKTPSDYTEKDEAVLSLDVEGPCVVYSKDFKSSDSKIKPAYDKIPVLRLLERQKLRLEAKAVLSTSRKHAKYQASLAGYKITKDGDIIFTLESFGQMSPNDILTKAAQILETKCDEFKKQLEE